MKREMTYRFALEKCRQVFFIWALVAFSGTLLHSQEIRIRVLNAHNGKPITNDCVDIFVHGVVTALVIPTDNMGVAVLHVEGERAVSAATGIGGACNGSGTLYPAVGRGDRIHVSSDYYVACQEYVKARALRRVPSDPVEEMMPSYSIGNILETGVAASNTCGVFRVRAKPGELILFVRPLTWLERMRQ